MMMYYLKLIVIFLTLSVKLITCKYLKVQLCNNDKNIITSTQITTTGIFAFIAVLVFKLLCREVLSINRTKTIETVKKVGYFSRK